MLKLVFDCSCTFECINISESLSLFSLFTDITFREHLDLILNHIDFQKIVINYI